MHDKVIGFAVTGSFCTLSEALDQMELLAQTGAQVVPIISPIVAATDTRFGKAADFVDRIEAISPGLNPHRGGGRTHRAEEAAGPAGGRALHR